MNLRSLNSPAPSLRRHLQKWDAEDCFECTSNAISVHCLRLAQRSDRLAGISSTLSGYLLTGDYLFYVYDSSRDVKGDSHCEQVTQLLTESPSVWPFYRFGQDSGIKIVKDIKFFFWFVLWAVIRSVRFPIEVRRCRVVLFATCVSSVQN